MLEPEDPRYRAMDLVSRHLSVESEFCRACVRMGYLTAEQMARAARRYRLGVNRYGAVIFWQIGLMGEVYDGKIMYYRADCHRDKQRKTTWVSAVMKAYYEYPGELPTVHGLFGAHLLKTTDYADYTDNAESIDKADGKGTTDYADYTDNTESIDKADGKGTTDYADYTDNAESIDKADGKGTTDCADYTDLAVAVVESEKTAVIMSELYRDYLWVAAGGLFELTPEKLFVLKGRKVVIFPDTDPEGEAFKRWYGVARKAEWLLGQRIFVSPLLEQHATAEQKRQKIDIADYYFARGK